MLKSLALHCAAAVYFLGLTLNQTKKRLLTAKYTNKNVKIISCGNLTMGGSGKTPFAGWLIDFLRKHGLNPAIITRGYKRQTTVPLSLEPLDKLPKNWHDYGDEPSWLFFRHQASIFIDKNKVAAIAKAASSHNALIIDDGFQQLSITKDIDFLLFDATKKLENLKLFPIGNLREPLKNSCRADAWVITKTNLDLENSRRIKKKLLSISNKIPIFTTQFLPFKIKNKYGKYVDVAKINKKNCHVILGIASPDSFLKTAATLGVKIDSVHTFQDHHAYQAKELKKIIQANQTWLTSEKDAVRLKDFFHMFDEIYTVEMEIIVNKNLENYLLNKLDLKKN